MPDNKTEIKDKNIYKMLHPRLTILVTSIDQEGKPNIITLAWSMITSFTPPMIAISVGEPRYSHDLIKNQKEFTVNIPTTEILQKTLFCGRVSGRDYDKFKITGLTKEPAEKVKPPLIKECIAHFECKVKDTMTTGDHTIFAAEILKATAKKGTIDKNVV